MWLPGNPAKLWTIPPSINVIKQAYFFSLAGQLTCPSSKLSPALKSARYRNAL
jgi:hypothetical protein